MKGGRDDVVGRNLEARQIARVVALLDKLRAGVGAPDPETHVVPLFRENDGERRAPATGSENSDRVHHLTGKRMRMRLLLRIVPHRLASQSSLGRPKSINPMFCPLK